VNGHFDVRTIFVNVGSLCSSGESAFRRYVLHYLGRYTHRLAISNHRLVSLTDGQVTFRWRDSAHHNEQKLLSLSVDEFLRRFLLHILPKSFVHIGNFGFLANRKRATLLPLCFQLLGSAQPSQAEQHGSGTEDFPDSWRCPKCGGPMRSSSDSPLPKSNFGLHHRSALRHETTLSNSKTPRSSGRSVPLSLVTQSIPSSSFFNHSHCDTLSP
jgi:rubredoxin